ncbi:hypothetical protein Tco_1321309 [Tanacetum coccineum]
MVYVVNGVLASGVDMVLDKDFASFALQEMEIHQLILLIQTLSMILQTFSPTLYKPSTNHTRVNYVGTTFIMVMIVHHGYRLSMSRNRATIKTLVIIRIHEIHQVFHNNIFVVETYLIDQSPPKDMSIQDMELQKQQYIEEMQSISNQIQIKDYHNERIDIRYRRECEIKIDELKGKFNGMSIEINKMKELRQLDQTANLSTYTTEPSRCFNSFYDDDDYKESNIPFNEIVSQIPPSIAITPVLPILEPENSLIMGDEDLSTIPEKESDKVIKSSVEDLVPIPSKSEDTSGSDSECDLPSYNDFSPINVSEEKYVTFSNPLFDSNDYFTSSDDESLSDKDVPEDNVLEDTESEDSYVSKLDKPYFLVTPLSKLNEDECFNPRCDFGDILLLEKLLNDDPSSPLLLKELNFEELKIIKSDVSTNFKDDYYDSEGDIIYLESLLMKDTIPNLPPEVFLDHHPKNLKDVPDNEDLKRLPRILKTLVHVVLSIVHSIFYPLHAYIWESDILDLID